MKHIIQVEKLVKSYGPVKAVRGVSFYAEEGSLFALLGENGAGKSTTIDMLATLLKPDAGRISVCGHATGQDDDAIRQSIGIVFQQSILDGDLSVQENLRLRGALYGLSRQTVDTRIQVLSASLGLAEFINRRYGKLSGGQRRRADIARALLHKPRLLILDEPTTGLDPASRKAIWQTVRTLQKQQGTSVLLTTHYMEEAAAADYVVVMGHGRVLAKGTAPELKSRFARDMLTLQAQNEEGIAEALRGLKAPYNQNGRQFTLPLENTRAALPLLAQLGSDIAGFEVAQGSLEDAFLRIIQEDKEAAA